MNERDEAVDAFFVFYFCFVIKRIRIHCLYGIAGLAIGFFPCYAFSQTAHTDTVKNKSPDSIATWSFYAEMDNYLFSYEPDIVTLITTADKGILHLEARYNYEARNAASVFGGVNFVFGNKLQLTLTPMLGLVFGELNGIAPGVETNLDFSFLNFNSQTEYVVDFSGNAGNFVYTSLQLGATLKNFGAGFTAQRTRLHNATREIENGMYGQYTFRKITGQFSYYNCFATDYFLMVTLSVNF